MLTARRDSALRRFLTAADITAAWGISRETFIREIERGNLPATKIGNQWRVKVEDADAYLAARERPPGWREAIIAALAAAPEPTPELCEKVAGLLGGAMNKAALSK